MNEASDGISEAKSMDVAKMLGIRLTTDQEPIIRTNTIVCLGKVTSLLTTKTKEKQVLPALMKGTKDRFKHARAAAVMALAAVQEFFPSVAIANIILPGIATLTADPEMEVRNQAFVAIKGLLARLEQESAVAAKAQIEAEAEVEREAANNPPEGGAVKTEEPVASGGMREGGWSSWLGSATSSAPASVPIPTPNTNLPASASPVRPASRPAIQASPIQASPSKPKADKAKRKPPVSNDSGDAGWGEEEDGGWGDDGDLDDALSTVHARVKASPVVKKAPLKKPPVATAAPVVVKPPIAKVKPSPVKVSASDGWGDDELSFDEPVPTPKPAKKVAVKAQAAKAKVDAWGDDSGWGDDDGW